MDAPPEAELPERVAEFERQSVSADRLSDDAALDAKRLAEHALQTQGLDRLTRSYALALAEVENASARRVQVEEGWADLWNGACTRARPPADMREWKSRIEQLLKTRSKVLERRDKQDEGEAILLALNRPCVHSGTKWASRLSRNWIARASPSASNVASASLRTLGKPRASGRPSLRKHAGILTARSKKKLTPGVRLRIGGGIGRRLSLLLVLTPASRSKPPRRHWRFGTKHETTSKTIGTARAASPAWSARCSNSRRQPPESSFAALLTLALSRRKRRPASSMSVWPRRARPKHCAKEQRSVWQAARRGVAEAQAHATKAAEILATFAAWLPPGADLSEVVARENARVKLAESLGQRRRHLFDLAEGVEEARRRRIEGF